MTRGMRTFVIVLACCGALTACSVGAEPGTTAATPSVPSRGSSGAGQPDAEPSVGGTSAADLSMQGETHDRSPAVAPAVQAYSDAFLGVRPARAYAFLSMRCHARLSLDDFTRSVTVAQTDGKARRIRFEDVTQNGAAATVTYDYTARATHPKHQTWVLEHGHWKNDDC